MHKSIAGVEGGVFGIHLVGEFGAFLVDEFCVICLSWLAGDCAGGGGGGDG